MVFAETQQHVGLAYSAVSDYQDLSQVVVSSRLLHLEGLKYYKAPELEPFILEEGEEQRRKSE